MEYRQPVAITPRGNPVLLTIGVGLIFAR